MGTPCPSHLSVSLPSLKQNAWDNRLKKRKGFLSAFFSSLFRNFWPMAMVFEPMVGQDSMAGTYGRGNHRQDERERGKRVETHNPHHRIVPVTCWHPTRPCLLKGLPSPTVVCKHMTHFLFSSICEDKNMTCLVENSVGRVCVLLTVVRVSHTNKQVKWVSVLLKLSTNNGFLPAYCTHYWETCDNLWLQQWISVLVIFQLFPFLFMSFEKFEILASS